MDAWLFFKAKRGLWAKKFWETLFYLKCPDCLEGTTSLLAPSQWVLGVQQQKLHAEHSPPSSTKVKNEWSSILHSLWYATKACTGKTLPLPTEVHTCLASCPFVLHPSALTPLAKFTPLLNLHPLILGLTPFGWLGSVMLFPYFRWEFFIYSHFLTNTIRA